MFEQIRHRAILHTVLCVLALLALNVYVAMRAFFTEYVSHMGSIEATYIGLTRYILNHPFELTWFPLWYAGIPYENTYPPLLQFCVAAVSWFAEVSPARAYHIVGGAVYCLGPITLFWLALRLSGCRISAFVAGLLYSIISPAAFLIGSVAQWGLGYWGPRRLQALVEYGEAPHLTAMALLPVAIVALDFALKRRRPLSMFLAALTLAAVVLSNWLGAFALAVAVFVFLLARPELKIKTWLHATGIGIAAYILASPWIPPGNLGDISRNAQFVVGSYPFGTEQVGYVTLLLAVTLTMAWMLRRSGTAPELRFSLLFSLTVGAIPLMAEWTGRYLVPQPQRYHLELEMGLVMVAAFGASALLRRVKTVVTLITVASLFLFALSQVIIYRHHAREMLRPLDITTTVEYEVARWLQKNRPGQRVFATGSVQFWLNVFSDNPQVGGGFSQGIVNENIPMIHYGIPFTSGDGERSAMWMRVYGVQAVVVGGPGSRDSYPGDWKDPYKFDGTLPELWRNGDDVIYEVPQRSTGLAYVVRPEHVVRQKPTSMTDIAPIESYAAALEDKSLPSVQANWTEVDKVVLRANLASEDYISVQTTCHEGWSALNRNSPIDIECDGLGFIVLKPFCEGQCEILLRYDGGIPARLTSTASGAIVLVFVAWFLIDRKKHIDNRL